MPCAFPRRQRLVENPGISGFGARPYQLANFVWRFEIILATRPKPLPSHSDEGFRGSTQGTDPRAGHDVKYHGPKILWMRFERRQIGRAHV
jgi:hypothetical protein